MPPRPHLALPSPGHAARRRRGRRVVRDGGRGAARPRRLPHHAADAHARAVPRGSRPTARTRPTCRASSCPRELRVEPADNGLGRVDYVLPRRPVGRRSASVIASLSERGLDRRTPVISLAKGLVPPHGIAPTVLLSASLGGSRVACIGGPAHAHEMVTEGAGLVAASTDERLAAPIAAVFTRAGVVCEQSNDPIGVELAGAAKNAAALAAGATAGPGPQRRRRRRRPHLPRGLALRRAAGRAAGVDDRAGRDRRPRRHRARAAEPQPPGRRAARPGRPGRGDPRPHRPGGRGARPRAAARQRARPRRTSRRRSRTRSTA